MRIFRTFMLALIPSFFLVPVEAHEYWIEPEVYVLEAGESLTADVRVGQMFDGASLMHSNSRVVWRRLANADGLHDIPGQDGDQPAIRLEQLAPGLNVLSLRSYPSSLRYESWEKFESFASKEGLEWVPNEHRERSLAVFRFLWKKNALAKR